MNKYYLKYKNKILQKKKEKLQKRNEILIAEGKPIPKRGRKSLELTEEQKKERQKARNKERQNEKIKKRNAMLIAEGKTIPKRGRRSKEEKINNLKNDFLKIIENKSKIKILEAIINKIKE